MISRGAHFEAQRANEIADLAQKYRTSAATVAGLWDHFKQLESQNAVNTPPQNIDVAENLEEKMTRLRRECAKLASRLDKKLELTPGSTNREYIRLANIGHNAMTVSQLEAKKQWLMKRIAETRPS